MKLNKFTETIACSVTPEEKQRIWSYALRNGTNVSKRVRLTLMAAVEQWEAEQAAAEIVL